MNKILLFGTALCVAGTISTNAWSFGGIFGGNHKSSHKGGVNAIGVHIDTNNTQKPNIEIIDGDNTETKECSGNGVKGVDDNCYCNQGYTGTNCETKLCESGSFCGMDGDDPLCCPSDHICTTAGDVLGTCWRAESGCTTNADCETAEGCAGGNCYCHLEAEDCETQAGGTCEPLGESTPSAEVKDDNGNVVFAAGRFLSNANYMNWWSARNWCEAQGRKMAYTFSFKFSQSISDDLSWCDIPCREDEACEYLDEYDGTSSTEKFVCKALGNNAIMELTDAYYGNVINYSREAIGNNWFWLGDDGSSCASFSYATNNGQGVIGNDAERDDDAPTTLCE